MTDKAILVVDDDPNALDIVRTFLESKGYTVATAKDGNDALTQLLQSSTRQVSAEPWLTDQEYLQQ